MKGGEIMTICTEFHKKYRGFWSAENDGAIIWSFGWVTFYTLKYGSFMEMIAELEKGLNELGVQKGIGDEIKFRKYL